MKVKLDLYVTECQERDGQYFLVVHREANPIHREHSRIDIPISEKVARYYEAHLKESEKNPRKRINLKGLLELEVE